MPNPLLPHMGESNFEVGSFTLPKLENKKQPESSTVSKTDYLPKNKVFGGALKRIQEAFREAASKIQ
jgi:hypothetical protein